MATAFITHSEYMTHDTGPYHPERPARLRAILDRLAEIRAGDPASPLNSLLSLTPQSAGLEWITSVHASAYVEAVSDWCRTGYTELPVGDTAISEMSYEVALLAAGGCLTGVDAVMDQRTSNAFCAVRPPGHHAEYDRGMGFCLFNNVAIATRYAQRRYGLDRVLIIDWDVHHGNGTQHLFDNDPTVFYISIHQSPHYPYTGLVGETGVGKGEGFTLNIPVRAGAGDEVYLPAFKEQIIPAVRKFNPAFILISAGFDAHRDDPLSDTMVTDEGFEEMIRMVRDLARQCCNGRLVSVLEGGYDIAALVRCIERHLLVLTEEGEYLC